MSNEEFKETSFEEIDIEIEPDDDENGTEDDEDIDSLISYKKRLKILVRELAKSENLDMIRISKKGLLRLREKIQFLTAILTLEIIDSLKNDKKITIMPRHVDEAITKMLEGADGLTVAIVKMEEMVRGLSLLNQNSSTERALLFMNSIETESYSKE